MFVSIVNSVVSIGIFGFVVAAVYMAFKSKWWKSFLSVVGALMTFLLAAAWSGFATGDMDSALGAVGLFALVAVGLVFFFVMQARSGKAATATSEA